MPKKQTKKIVNNLKQVPENMTEAQAQEFWQSHLVGKGLLKEPLEPDLKAKLLQARSERKLRQSSKVISRNITLNLSENLEGRLRHLAELKKTSYQTLLKEFVLERVYEEEKRMGVVGS